MAYKKGNRISVTFSCGFKAYFPTSSAPAPSEIALLEEEAALFHQDHCEPGCDGR